MLRHIGFGLLFAATATFTAAADTSAAGTVIDHTGEAGELVVTRDGGVFWLSVGDELFHNDVLSTQNESEATVLFNGCELTLRTGMEVTLDDDFCTFAAIEGPTMAMLASQGGVIGSAGVASTASAPLTVGGVVLAAGGLIDAVNGGNGGTESAASVAAGAPAANTVSN